MIEKVLDYIESQEDVQKDILLCLHDHLMGYDMKKVKLSYGLPFYSRNSWICYLSPKKEGNVELVFPRAIEIPSIHKFVDFKDRKIAGGITYNSIEEIDFEILSLILNEMILLDNVKKFSLKRTKK